MADTRLPSWWQVSRAVGRVTFREILREKVLYNVLLCAACLLGMGFLAARLSFVAPTRIVLDMGLSSVGISCAMIAIFLGAGLVGREFERRTIHVALSRPIGRGQFVLGKFFGICGVLALNWALLSAAFVAILAITGGGIGIGLAPHLGWALGLALLQSFCMAAIVICFSTFTTVSLSAVFALGLFLVGHNITELLAAIGKLESPVTRGLAGGFARSLPDLEHFSVGLKLTYGILPGWRFLAESTLYAGLLSAAFLLLAGFLIQKKEL